MLRGGRGFLSTPAELSRWSLRAVTARSLSKHEGLTSTGRGFSTREDAVQRRCASVSWAPAGVPVVPDRVPGYGAGGHAYGDALGEAERAALLEYLKTL